MQPLSVTSLWHHQDYFLGSIQNLRGYNKPWCEHITLLLVKVWDVLLVHIFSIRSLDFKFGTPLRTSMLKHNLPFLQLFPNKFTLICKNDVQSLYDQPIQCQPYDDKVIKHKSKRTKEAMGCWWSILSFKMIWIVTWMQSYLGCCQVCGPGKNARCW